jgi:hypothetical protein
MAEREVESAERQFRDSGFDIGLGDREKICGQLAALKAARARARQAWLDASEEETDPGSRSG